MNKKFPQITKEFLEQKLILERRTRIGLAREIGCSKRTLIHYCKKYNLYDKIKKITPVHPNFIDLTGQRFGKLIVKGVSPDKKWGKPLWICECDCKKEITVPATSLKRGFTITCTKCVSVNYCGYKEISKTYWTRIKNRSVEKGFEFDITQEYIWDLFLKQNKKCFLSNINIYFHHTYSKQTASIDRIDSKKGYIQGNIQIIHKRLQKVKSDLPNNELYSWCREIYLKHKGEDTVENNNLEKIGFITYDKKT